MKAIKRVALPVGHSILKNGNITSADGTSKGGVNEYNWCKKFVPYLAEEFRGQNVYAQIIICPEYKFTSATQEKNYKLDIINNGNFDLVIENHLNCFNSKAQGTETLFSKGSKDGEIIAQSVNDQLDDIFPDRGAKARDDLYILRQTRPVAILNEYFFCDNKQDYSKADEVHEMKLIAKKVVKGVLRGDYKENSTNTPSQPSNNGGLNLKTGEYNRKVRVLPSIGLNVRKYRGVTNDTPLDKLKQGEIVEIKYVKDNWASISINNPKAINGVGYICCEYVEFV